MNEYKEFWDKLREQIAQTQFPLQISTSNKSPILLVNSGIESINYAFAVEYQFPEVMIFFDSEREDNDYLFDNLLKQKIDIEDAFGNELIWSKKSEHQKHTNIGFKNLKMSYKKTEQWDEMIGFMIAQMEKLYAAFQQRVLTLWDKIQEEKKLKRLTVPPRMETVKIQNFLNFKNLEFPVSKGINLFIGENDTGKTSLLKLLYTVSKSWEIYGRREYYEKMTYKKILGDKLFDTFQPRENRRIGDLITKNCKEKLKVDITYSKTEEYKQNIAFQFGESTYKTINECPDELDTVGLNYNCVFIPAKEVLTAFRTIKYIRERLFLPGFDDTYTDLIKSLETPTSFKDTTTTFTAINQKLDTLFSGNIQSTTGEEPFIFVRDKSKFSISLTSEGIKKVGMLSSLVRSKQIKKGSLLFIDEPEANLHPKTIRQLVDILANIAAEGVQLFLASHSFFVITQLAISAKKYNIPVYCHSLEKGKDGFVTTSLSNFLDGFPSNPIIDEMKLLLEEEKKLK